MIQDSYARARTSHKSKLREEGRYFEPLVSDEKSTHRWLAEWAPWPSGTAVISGMPCGLARAELISSEAKHYKRANKPAEFSHLSYIW